MPVHGIAAPVGCIYTCWYICIHMDTYTSVLWHSATPSSHRHPRASSVVFALQVVYLLDR